MLGSNFVYYPTLNSVIQRRGKMMKPQVNALRPSLNKTTKGNRINFTPLLEPFSYTLGDESARVQTFELLKPADWFWPTQSEAIHQRGTEFS